MAFRRSAPAASRRPRALMALRRGDKGYVIAMSALLILPLVVFTAFATDVGQWYAQATRMQRAADAAALAAVPWLDDKINPSRYITVAEQTAAKNGYAPGSSLNGGTVQIDVTRPAANRVRVEITAPALIFFGGVARDSEILNRGATAEFNLSVPLGSPRNYLGLGDMGLGAENTTYEASDMWLAISGRCTDKQQGDRLAAYQAANDSSNTCHQPINQEYNDANYQIYVELPEGRTYATDVLIYNGNFYHSRGNSCDSGSNNTNPTREFCPGGLDSRAQMDTTFTLYQADSTVFDDSDNPLMSAVNGCQNVANSSNGTKTFDGNVFEDNAGFNPNPSLFSNRYGWWRLCRIPASAPAGRYLLKVRNQDSTSGNPGQNNGSNAYGIVADRVGSSGLCDSRTDAQCPRVFAKEYLSIFALASGQTRFFLAEVGSQHAGKRVQLELWDSAEGASSIRVLKPTGCNSWSYQTFDWRVDANNGSQVVGWQTNRQTINLPGNGYNNDLITIQFDLPTNWNPGTCNMWFRIEYTYSSNATDRTTWSLKILGDPVHLVE